MITIEEKLYKKMPPEIKIHFNELYNSEREEVVSKFPDSKSTSGGRSTGRNFGQGENEGGKDLPRTGHNDSGSASRFFYCAKASKAERNKGCEELENKNNHSTVKPLKLMSYLVRLITPKGGTILDPYMGSGSTGIGAKLEGFDFIGIENNEEYFKIANKRLCQEGWL
jgi:site-specific DNA-methyltransferase (adenine-specific)